MESQFLGLELAFISNLSLLLGLKPFKKSMMFMVVGRCLNPILVFSISLAKLNKIGSEPSSSEALLELG